MAAGISENDGVPTGGHAEWNTEQTDGSTVRPLIGIADGGPDEADLGLFATQQFADGTAEIPRQSPDPYEPRPAGTGGPGRRRRAKRRTRKGLVVAVAVVAAVVTAGIVGLADGTPSDKVRDDLSAPDDGSAVPGLLMPSHEASGADATRTAAPTASHTSGAAASPGSSPSPQTSSGLPSVPATPAATGSPGAGSPSRPGSPSSPARDNGDDGPVADGTVLKPGYRGSEVVELQERLRQVGLYDGPSDGKYDGGVKSAVQRYQQGYQVTGDETGFYGPNTRRSLESRTSGS
ncbi:hypothetical protein GCM10020367_61390 [Streptomyces sannanensis]|uniref:Peptidoglycan binding-like domain-containing protein n=1 Tax=Streptomyces sannanensis TaxID=285536 RepID=A0ABP6SLI7_9ACTN